ncbi:N-acetylglucosamine kinase [Paenibacillus radicis (ex Xue et al. 2023)]|uniref:N-acetylglucosamine kinase n=1 Tax=Paenibacillus radicis (ex Xue et al. 2023) TaxID=2972489 RepID=A0ABT1YKK4_9BACL|nr:BadF/BadG/BcrA/BcrD ATPase family protein [Paenibacillus radicis (ex Xue et al. 2023)]MCR8632924.1 N-acetylglucosamine kinase [Paenibacillus radicis (ex Xue et al. 2023)]
MTGKSSRRFLAVDGGGTKTALLVGDEEGHVLSLSYGGSSNLKSRPWDEVKTELSGLIRRGLELSGSSREQVAGIVLGLAGSDRPEDKARIVEHLAAELPQQAVITVYNDAITALAAGTFGERGMVLISGTGSICCGFDPATDEYIRVGGWGYVFGDEGSGFDLGKRGLQAVMKAYDGRTAPTLLTDKILARLSLASPDKLITAIYEADNMRAKVASLSPAVFEAAKEGDAAAEFIVSEAVRELAALAAATHCKLKHGTDKTPLILSGGVFQEPYFLEAFTEWPQIRALSLDIRCLNVPPVIGSYYFAVKQAGLLITPEMINTIQQQCNDKGEKHDDTAHKANDNGTNQ